MSLRATARALPALGRAAFLEALAYRAELVVWVLSTTLPLVMLALFSAVTREAPLGRYGPKEVTLYFLLAFVVRQLTGSWVAWQLTMEVREGTLGMKLLRPVNPLVGYAVQNLAAFPLRSLIALPVAIGAVAWVGADALPRDPALWAVFALALLGAWLLTFLANVAIGALSLYMESSLSLMDVWLMLYLVFSGYTVPVDLFPAWLRGPLDWMPFRYQMSFPIEVLTAGLDPGQALGLLARQWGMVAAVGALTALIWRRGLSRFAAYGG